MKNSLKLDESNVKGVQTENMYQTLKSFKEAQIQLLKCNMYCSLVEHRARA